MTFHAYDIALEMIRALREPLVLVQARDGSLADQLRRAAASVPLNLVEGRRRAGKDRLHHWRVAAGSADEARACLEVAEALGYLAEPARVALARLDSLLAVTWRLTH